MKKVFYFLFMVLGTTILGQITGKVEFKKVYKIKEYQDAHNIGFGTTQKDSEDNFYIFDKYSLKIHKYNKHGKYIKSVGRRGRGPKEFLHFSFVYVNQKDQIIVIDRYQNKIKTFDSNLNYLTSKTFSYEKFYTTYSAVNVGEYILTGSIDSPTPLRFVESDFSDLVKELNLNITQYYTNNRVDKENIFYGSFTTNLIYFNNKIIYSPYFYSGKLLAVETKTDWLDEENYQTEYIKGYQCGNIPYRVYKPNERNHIKGFSMTNRGRDEIIVAELNISRGIYNLNNEWILNLIRIKKGDYAVLGFEVYNKELKYLGFYEIKRKKLKINNYPHIRGAVHVVFSDNTILWAYRDENDDLIYAKSKIKFIDKDGKERINLYKKQNVKK